VKLLFTDVQMPGSLNGMQLAHEVHERWPHVLLVMTSGRERPARAEIPDDGRFVAKPHSAEELLGQVRSAVRIIGIKNIEKYNVRQATQSPQLVSESA
jgi:DNA-binding NtrC family response regulator